MTQLEADMHNFSQQLTEIEKELANNELYDVKNKQKLTALLTQQTQCKKALDNAELEWLHAQEELERLSDQCHD